MWLFSLTLLCFPFVSVFGCNVCDPTPRDATSTGVDPLHPPWAAVDGALASFWLSTGLFPQTLTIRLQRPVVVYEVR